MSHHTTEGLVFLSDLSGFMRLTREMELEELHDALKTFAEITVRHVESAGGTVCKYAGDAALGFFPGDRTDDAVRALFAMKRSVETDMIVRGRNVGLRVGAHFGQFLVATLPPFDTPDVLGETVNIAATMGSGGQNKHRDRFLISPEAFRKLAPETRKLFHKFTEPIVYLAEA